MPTLASMCVRTQQVSVWLSVSFRVSWSPHQEVPETGLQSLENMTTRLLAFFFSQCSSRMLATHLTYIFPKLITRVEALKEDR